MGSYRPVLSQEAIKPIQPNLGAEPARSSQETIKSELTSRVEGLISLENYRALVNRAVEVFGDPIRASTWLSTPNADLNGETPLEMARTRDYDPSVFEPYFVRIEHGIY